MDTSCRFILASVCGGTVSFWVSFLLGIWFMDIIAGQWHHIERSGSHLGRGMRATRRAKSTVRS